MSIYQHLYRTHAGDSVTEQVSLRITCGGRHGREAKKSRAVTTSAIKGLDAACSCRHMAETARAWNKPLTGKFPPSFGSAISANFLLSLKRGRACTNISHHFTYESLKQIAIQKKGMQHNLT